MLLKIVFAITNVIGCEIASKVNAKRRSYTARAKGIETVEPVFPEADRVELEIYGQENQFVHAIALKIYHSSQ